MSVNPTPWQEQLDDLEPQELEALEPVSIAPGTMRSGQRSAVDEDEDVTLLDPPAPAGHPVPSEPAVAAFPWAGLLLAVAFWGSVVLTLRLIGVIK